MTDQTQDNSHVANTALLKGFGEVRILLSPDLKEGSNRNSLLESFPFQERLDSGVIREKGEPRHACTLILTKDQMEALLPAARAAAKKKFGPDVDIKSMKFPFKSGDKVAEKRREKNKDGDDYEGKILLNPKAYPNQFDPDVSVCILKDGELVEYRDWANAGIKDSELYSGMWGHVKLAFVGYKGQREEDKDGVTVYLRSIVKTKDGDRIGGSTASSDFSAVAGRETDEDPTASSYDVDDDIVVE